MESSFEVKCVGLKRVASGVGLAWNGPVLFMRSSKLFLPLAAALVVGETSCVSARFQQEWASPQVSNAPVRISGNWSGLWWSEGPSGHSGPLRAVVRVSSEGERSLRQRKGAKMDLVFDAGFGGWQTLFLTVHKGYDSQMTLTPAGDHYDVEGRQVLSGLGGGEYRYSGGIYGDRFELRYESAYDTGTFYLERVK